MVCVTVSAPGASSGSAIAGLAVGATDARAAGGAMAAEAEAFAPAGGAAAFAGPPPPGPPPGPPLGEVALPAPVPSATRHCEHFTSADGPTFLVALCVSISAMMSPALTVWPSSTNHLASLPSSMVGDRAGIRISVGIASHLFFGGGTPLAHPAARPLRLSERPDPHCLRLARKLAP